MSSKQVAIIIPVFNRKDVTLHCLKQLVDIDWNGNPPIVIVVDDGSRDGTAEAVREQYPGVYLMEGNGNLWWSGAINLGIEKSLNLGCEKVLFLNDDLILDKNFFNELQVVSESNENALVSSIKLYNENNASANVLTGGFRTAGMLRQLYNLGGGGTYEDYKNEFGEVVECDALTGAALLIPAHIFSILGRLDIKDFPHNGGDLEFTMRASKRGLQCLVATNSRVYTEPNPNYYQNYLKVSSRKEYLHNLLDDRKYNYGFSRQWKMATMHKPLLLGIFLFVFKFLGLLRWTFLKVVLPRQFLVALINKRADCN